MTPLQELYGVFFAIFWGSVIGAQSKYKPFGWLGSCRHDIPRNVVSFLLLNLAPIFVFYFIFRTLRYEPDLGFDCTGFGAIFWLLFSVIGTVISVYRFWLALIFSLPQYFYRCGINDPCFAEDVYDRKIDHRNLSGGNLAYALIYVIVGVIATYFLLNHS
jgi:hypothetical protein